MAVSYGRLEVETPDHVVLRYDLAGGGNRGFAALVDFLIAMAVVIGALFLLFFGVGLVARYTGIPAVDTLAVAGGLAVFLTPTVIWAYFILLEWLWNGQTVGKRLYELRVINEDGSPARFVAVLVRNLVRLVDFLPAFYGVGLLSIVVTTKNQRLGDIAAGTYVVRAPRPNVDWLALRTVTPLGAGETAQVRALPGEVQRLVREFVAREGALAPADRARVAALIAARLRPYANEPPEKLDDVAFIRAVARSLRESAP